MDLQVGYHHISLDEASIPNTAFTSPFGKHEYIKVPFRLAQTPAYFQELTTGMLKDLNFAIAYLDDIIIFSKTVEEHLDHIKQVFKKLRSAHLLMKISRCHCFTKEIQYLGHILSMKGITPLPSKTQAIQNMIPPKMPKQVCAFLGPVGYYKKFIKNIAKTTKPLSLLTHQQAKFDWTPTHHNSFLTLNPFTYCYKLHIHTDAFLEYFCMYINIHILDIYIDISMYECVHIFTCMYKCYMTV